ncbi:hypothetical protein TrRE_jg7613, partial [Triparma retinervis]
MVSLSPNAVPFPPPPPQTPSGSTTFDKFPILADDLQVYILSFIAQAPFELYDEGLPRRDGNLTHILNHVSRSWRRMCNGNVLWRLALERKLKNKWC